MALSPTVIAFVVAIVTAAVTYALRGVIRGIITYYRMIRTGLTLPCAPGHWFWGNMSQVKSIKDLQYLGRKLSVKHKLYVIWLGLFLPFFFVSHPDSVKAILSTSEPKAGMVSRRGRYTNLLPWLGEGLLISHGKKWERNRRLLTPAFHFTILQSYVEIYNQATDTMMKVLEKATNGWSRSVDIYKPIGRAALDVMLRTAFSYQDNIQDQGESHPYVNAMIKLSSIIERRSINPIMSNSDFLFFKTKAGREFLTHSRYVHDVAYDLIRKRRDELEGNPDLLKTKHLDFLDILLSARDDEGVGLSDVDIRSEVDTFLFEGHDTTSSAISWILYSLAEHQDIQNKVYAEVCEVLGTRNEVEWADLSRFQYLTQVIREGMRMHSPVFAIGRQLSKPVTFDGVTVPTGTNITISIDNLNHNPNVWDNPEKFDPERFRGKQWDERDPYSFVPFSAGPRNCIGQNFAMNEEKVFIARLVQRFMLKVDTNIKAVPFPCIVMRAKDGLQLYLQPRSERFV